MSFAFCAALLVNILGCALVYLAAPRQQLWPELLSHVLSRILFWSGATVLIVAFALYGRSLSGGAWFYVPVTVAMTVWTLLPFAAALMRKGLAS